MLLPELNGVVYTKISSDYNSPQRKILLIASEFSLSEQNCLILYTPVTSFRH
jgi:hypothetical protein